MQMLMNVHLALITAVHLQDAWALKEATAVSAMKDSQAMGEPA